MLKARELVRSLDAEDTAFVQTFHRIPTTEDPVFFQPDTDLPVPMEPVMLCVLLGELANRTGASAAEVYAYHKMDRQLTADQNIRNFEAAVHEAYRIMFAAQNLAGGKGPRKGSLKLLKPRGQKS
jgi:hypothetical protein